MEKKKIILILLIISLIGLAIIFASVKIMNQEPVQQIEIQQEEQETGVAQQYQMTEEDKHIDSATKRSLEVRETMQEIWGTLLEVEDDYFVIRASKEKK